MVVEFHNWSECAEQSCQQYWYNWYCAHLAEFCAFSGDRNLDCIQRFDVEFVAQGNDFDAFAL